MSDRSDEGKRAAALPVSELPPLGPTSASFGPSQRRLMHARAARGKDDQKQAGRLRIKTPPALRLLLPPDTLWPSWLVCLLLAGMKRAPGDCSSPRSKVQSSEDRFPFV